MAFQWKFTLTVRLTDRKNLLDLIRWAGGSSTLRKGLIRFYTQTEVAIAQDGSKRKYRRGIQSSTCRSACAAPDKYQAVTQEDSRKKFLNAD